MVFKITEKELKTIDKEILQTWEKPYRDVGAKESTKAFETFLIYRDMGITRSLHQLAKETGLKYNAIAQWSSRYNWADRINAMNEYKIQENKKINQEIQRKEIDRINQRLDAKSKLINVLIQVLINNADKYNDAELDIKEFSSMLNLVSKIENMNIADLENIKNLEQMLSDDGVDAQSINALVNNFNVLLSANNSDAIDTYQDELKDDEY